MFTILFNSNLYLQTQIGKETNSGLIQSSLGSSCPKLRHFLDSSLSLTPHPATAHSIGSTSTVPSSSLHLYCFSPGPPSCSSITPGAWNLASWIHSGPLQCRSHLAFRVTFEKQKSEDITPLGKILHESLTPIPAPGYSCPPLPACLSALSGHQHHSCLVSPPCLDARPQPPSAYSGLKSNVTPTSFITHLEKTQPLYPTSRKIRVGHV